MLTKFKKVPGSEIGFHKPGVQGYLIIKNGKVVGFMMKYPNTKTEFHPWKVFATGVSTPLFPTLLDCFYTDRDFKRISKPDEYTQGGGLDAAKRLAKIYFDSI
jgi:hypothetical protein